MLASSWYSKTDIVLKCLYTNIDGLNASKGSELDIIIQREDPDVICLTETKLSSHCTLTQYLNCQTYNVFRKDRTTGGGGGVLMMVRNSLTATQLSDDVFNDVEAVVCQIGACRNGVKVACIYRPPGSPPSYNAQIRKSISCISANQQSQVLVCGDFNYREIDWVETDVEGGLESEQAKFLDECLNSFLYQHVREFTRVRGNDQPSVLDLVLSRSELEVIDLEYLSPVGSSDHCILSFRFTIDHGDHQGQMDGQDKRNFHKGDYELASTMFDEVNWEGVLTPLDVDEAWNVFLNKYQSTISQTVPLYSHARRGRYKKKWVTREVLQQVKLKEDAWSKLRKNRNSKRLRQLYVQARNTATKTVRKAKYDFEHKLANEIKSNPKAFYAYARSKTSIKEDILMVKKQDGELTATLEETCEEMNEQFQKVFIKTAGVCPPGPSFPADDRLTRCEFDVDDVYNILTQLNPSAPGPDGIHPVVLKNCA